MQTIRKHSLLILAHTTTSVQTAVTTGQNFLSLSLGPVIVSIMKAYPERAVNKKCVIGSKFVQWIKLSKKIRLLSQDRNIVRCHLLARDSMTDHKLITEPPMITFAHGELKIANLYSPDSHHMETIIMSHTKICIGIHATNVPKLRIFRSSQPANHTWDKHHLTLNTRKPKCRGWVSKKYPIYRKSTIKSRRYWRPSMNKRRRLIHINNSKWQTLKESYRDTMQGLKLKVITMIIHH